MANSACNQFSMCMYECKVSLMQASQELELVDNQRFHIYYEDANN
jgi:hypothetical protein